VKKLNEFTLLRPANTTVWGMGKGEIINRGKEKEKEKKKKRRWWSKPIKDIWNWWIFWDFSFPFSRESWKVDEFSFGKE
jgi:hypothetical protein